MNRQVQRFIVHACPAPEHPEYYPWQTAQVCLFVGDDNQQRALAAARGELRRQHWFPIGPFRKDTLVEKRVLDCGLEDVKAAYREAKAGKIMFKFGLDQMPMTTKEDSSVLRFPKIGESFMDRVIVGAGGRRLTKAEADQNKTRNADYIIQDAVVELKDLQEEGLLVTSRQERLAQLLRPIASGAEYTSLSPNNLSETQWIEYVDILGRPIQNQVKSAAKQLKASCEKLGFSRSGVIFLNTGYSSIPHQLFVAIVHRYCSKDTRHVDFAVCISSWLLTNGFDSECFIAFDPREGGGAIVSGIRDSFWKEEADFMTSWARSQFPQDGEMLKPVEPIAFSH